MIQRSRRLRMGHLVVATLCLLLVTVFISALITFVPHWWAADMLVHFRIQYLAIGLLGLLAMMLSRNLPLVLLATAVLVLNAAPVYLYFQDTGAMSGAAVASPQARTTRFKIAGANVFKRNEDYPAIADWIKREQPDAVVLVEATTALKNELILRLPQYDNYSVNIGPSGVGKVVLARVPLHTVATLHSTGTRSAAQIVALRRDHTTLNLAAVHAIWPVNPQYAALRNRELADLAVAARAHTGPLVMLGDFNVSPFSMHFQHMLKEGGLRRATAGRGWYPTWPVFLLPAGIQIDHMLVNHRVRVEQLRVGSGIGSDHRWIVADLLVDTNAALPGESLAHK